MKWNINWDALGITTSVACAIHCALLPLFFTALPLFGINIIHNHWFEVCMIILAFAIGARSFYHSYKKHHHSVWPSLMFVIGLMLLIAKQLWHSAEIVLLIPAVILVVSAHILNFRLCRVHNHAHSTDCNH